jgi:shikimate kinase
MRDNSTVTAERNKQVIRRSIVLVGLMGAGKSTVGRRLAREIGAPFIDSDTAIAEAAECSISDIFEIYGETMFRDLEQRVIIRLLSDVPQVIATGGGAFMNPEIRAEIKAKALSLWLRADINVLVERVSRRNTRPLLEGGDKRAILTRLMNDRGPVYNMADIVVDNNINDHDKVVEEILKQLKERKEI